MIDRQTSDGGLTYLARSRMWGMSRRFERPSRLPQWQPDYGGIESSCQPDSWQSASNGHDRQSINTVIVDGYNSVAGCQIIGIPFVQGQAADASSIGLFNRVLNRTKSIQKETWHGR